MKAVRLHREGGPEQLVYEDAPEPELGAEDALIRVHATGITPAELTWADTYRNCDGSERLPAIPGHEVSGVVEGVAHGVSDVSIGEEVYALIEMAPPRSISRSMPPTWRRSHRHLIMCRRPPSRFQRSRSGRPSSITRDLRRVSVC